MSELRLVRDRVSWRDWAEANGEKSAAAVHRAAAML